MCVYDLNELHLHNVIAGITSCTLRNPTLTWLTMAYWLVVVVAIQYIYQGVREWVMHKWKLQHQSHAYWLVVVVVIQYIYQRVREWVMHKWIKAPTNILFTYWTKFLVSMTYIQYFFNFTKTNNDVHQVLYREKMLLPSSSVYTSSSRNGCTC